MSFSEKFKISSKTGDQVEIEISVDDYQTAATLGLNLSQYLSRKFGPVTDEVKFGPVIGQIMSAAGLFLSEDPETGYRAPTMKEVLSGMAAMNVGAITRNDGTQNNTPSGRLLFPEIVMRVIESELRADNGDFLGGFENLIASTVSITSPKFEQPIINVKAPESSEDMAISQNAEPATMIGITVSDVSRAIPTHSIGLTISDQALQATTLDLVNIIMSAQARGKRIRMAENNLKAILSGDVDQKMSALPTRKAKPLDNANISNAGEITHLAWVKYLRTNYQKRSITNVVTDIDTAYAIEQRTGRPNIQTNFNGNGSNFAVNATVDNLLAQSPRILMVDSAILGANTIMGLDNRFALRRVVNVAATYSAIEQYVMRRAQAMRVDFGEMTHRLFDDAFDVLTLTL